MEQHDYRTEFVYMDSYNWLLDGAKKAAELLEAGKTREALEHLNKSIDTAQIILEHKLDLSMFRCL